MAVFTLFSNLYAAAIKDIVDDPSLSQESSQIKSSQKHNILYYKVEEIELDNTQTRTINFASYATTQWVFLVARVIGQMTANITGLDTGGGAITGKIQGFGTINMPGLIILSGTKINSGGVIIESHADNSVMELFAGIAAEDDDPLMDTNA